MAYKIYQQLESGMANKGLITSTNIDDNALGKTQAELNAIFNANLTGSIEFISVDELPTASANTMQKIYLVPSTNVVSQNVKDEYVTLKDDAQVYEMDYIIFKPSGQPSVSSEGFTGVLTEDGSVATLDVYQNGTLVNTFTPERGTVVYVPGENIHYVVYDPSNGQSQTAKGWKSINKTYAQYTWELIGSTSVDLSGYYTSQQINNILGGYQTSEQSNQDYQTIFQHINAIEQNELTTESPSNASKMWNPICEIYFSQAAAQDGTTRPSGNVSQVWAKFPKYPENVNFGQAAFDSLVIDGDGEGADITLWEKFNFSGPLADQNPPYIIELNTQNNEQVNVTNYHMTFYPDGTSE